MPPTEREQTPSAPSMDLERARLRAAGCSEAEINLILAGRQGVGRVAPPTGPGIMTGVGGNLAAAAGFVRNFIPSVIADMAMMLNRTAPSATRIQAAAYLATKALVVMVVAYVVMLEFSQLRSVTSKASTDACLARRQLITDTMPFIPLDSRLKTPHILEWEARYAEFRRDCAGFTDSK